MERRYDGGTNYTSLEFPKKGYLFHLLFTAGLSGVGTRTEQTPDVLDAPVYSICSSVQCNEKYLRMISRKSGGRFFDLTGGILATEISEQIGSDNQIVLVSVTSSTHQISGRYDLNAIWIKKTQ